MSPPLKGFTVVDLSRGAAGPRLSGMLADYGADVVWVEAPGGDPFRDQQPAAASVFNRGKRSIVLDVLDRDDCAVVHDLVRRADLVVESWEPGFASSVGLGPADVRALNPGAVYCSISAFGTEGAHTDVPDHEAFVHAIIGSMAEQAGHREGPIYMALPFASVGASYLAMIGILAAWFRRESDGYGRAVETSLFDGALAYLSVAWGENDFDLRDLVTGEVRPPAPTKAMSAGKRFVTRSFECADGTFLGIHTGAVGAFSRFMVECGLDDRIPASVTGMDMGADLEPHQIPIVMDELPTIVRSRNRADWVERLLRADVCAVEHLAPCEVFDTPQAQHNGAVVEVDDPVLGRVQQVGPALRISSVTRAEIVGAPRPDEHRNQILDELNGEPLGLRPAPSGEPDRRPLLDGIRIVDFGAYFAGPYSSRLLCDLGAQVIKLEPKLGDQLRGLERCFNSAQAGKISFAGDFKSEHLRPVSERLLRWADIVHHNMRPGAAERLGLGYEDLVAVSPNAIYVHAPGWGSTGPHRNRQSFAPMLSGYVGVTSEVAGEYNAPLPPLAHEDPGNGLLGAVGMLLALLHRERTGDGAYVENPQLNAAMAHVSHIVRAADGTAVGASTLDVLQLGRGALDQLYRTSDGWVCVVAESEAEIASLEKAIGFSIRDDPRFTTRALRHENRCELQAVIESALDGRQTDEVVDELRSLGVGVAPSPRNMHAVLNDPQMRSMRRVAEVPHRDQAKGMVREVDQVVRISDTTLPAHRFAPGLGEHTVEVLGQLGFSSAEIDELLDRQVVVQMPTDAQPAGTKTTKQPTSQTGEENV